MVGKIKRVRQKLHQDAVKLLGPDCRSESGAKPPGVSAGAPGGGGGAPGGGGGAPGGSGETSQAPCAAPQALTGVSFPSGIFAGTRISPEALVQTLKFDETPDVPTEAKQDLAEKRSKSKKEKKKERRDRWLSKISAIIQTKERQQAEARRLATPVVGDMRPLADALPELCQLIAPAAAAAAGPSARRKSRKTKPVKRATPTDFSQMKPAQKRKLLEAERSVFADSLKTLSTKTDPLLDIGEQLRKRMRQEEEQRPS